MILAALLLSAVSSWTVSAAGGPAAREEAAARYRASIEAYRAADFAGFRRETEAALAAAPGHPRYLYNLACAQALTGEPAAAVGTLGRLAAMGLWFDLAADSDLASLAGRDDFARVTVAMAALLEPVGRAERALGLADPLTVPEGIAHDPADGSFYLGSVHRGEVRRVDPAGAAVRVAGPEEGLWAVLGMAVDAERRALWVCTSAMREHRGFRPEDEGKAALVRLPLGGNRTAGAAEPAPATEGGPARYPLPGPGPHNCNDLVLAPDGTVWVADSLSGAVFRLPPGGATLETAITPGILRSPNGLAVAPDGSRLWLSDYPEGLFTVALRDGRPAGDPAPLAHPDTVTLRGIDGLALHRRGGRTELLAVRNGYRPHRVLGLTLDPTGTRVDRADTLLANHPDFDEPTLGTVAGDRFYLVANSHWNRFGDDGTLPPADDLTPPVVLAIELDTR